MIIDRIIYTFARRWLLLANLFFALYVGLPMVAPILMQVGLTGPARTIYAIYSPFCHQMASRSFFFFGEQVAYPREVAGTNLTPIEAFMPSLPEFQDASPDPNEWETFMLPARQFVGNATMGYKLALCQRDISLYLAMLFGGILFGFLRYRVKIKPMPFWLFLLVGPLPIALDGFSQLLSQFSVGFGLDVMAIRESTPFLRSLTGTLFGLSLVWLIYPRLDEQMAIIARDQAEKLAAADRTVAETPPVV